MHTCVSGTPGLIVLWTPGDDGAADAAESATAFERTLLAECRSLGKRGQVVGRGIPCNGVSAAVRQARRGTVALPLSELKALIADDETFSDIVM